MLNFFNAKKLPNYNSLSTLTIFMFVSLWIGVISPFFSWVYRPLIFNANLPNTTVWLILSTIGIFVIVLLCSVVFYIVWRTYVKRVVSLQNEAQDEQQFSEVLYLQEHLSELREKVTLNETVSNIEQTFRNNWQKNMLSSIKTMQELLKDVLVAAEKVDFSSGDLYKILSHIHHVSLTLEEISKSMNNSTDTVKQNMNTIVVKTQEVSSALHDYVNFVGNIEDVIKQGLVNIDHYRTELTVINDIVITILDINRHTQILALNAAIEARRLGEKGRGFVVVANEVQNISQKITELSRHIKTAAQKMNTQNKELITVLQDAKTITAVQKNDVPTVQRLLSDVETVVENTERSFQMQADLVKELSLNTVLENVDHLGALTAKNNKVLAQISPKLMELVDQSSDIIDQFQDDIETIAQFEQK